jgi:hypothetical protein
LRTPPLCIPHRPAGSALSHVVTSAPVDAEYAPAPTPDYIAGLRTAGRDTFRFNRLRTMDDLTGSGSALAARRRH